MRMRVITHIALAVLLLLVVPCGILAQSDSTKNEPRVYTQEHPLIYEDAWDLWPYVFLDEGGRPTGYNVELMKMIFSELGIPYEIRLKSTQQALEDLRAGRSDLMLGMKADFHDEYANYYGKTVVHLFTHSVVHPSGYSHIVHNLHDLATQQVIVHNGSFSHHLMQDYGWEQNAQPFDDMEMAVQMVSAENNGQVLWNTMSLKWLKHKYRASNLTLSPVDMPSGEYRFMSHDSLLLDRLDAAYTRLKSGERLQPLEMRWFYPEETMEHNTPVWLWYVAIVMGAIAMLLAVATLFLHLRERRATADGRLRINRLAFVLKTCKVNIWTYDVKKQTISWYGDDARTQSAITLKAFVRRFWLAELEQLKATVRQLIDNEIKTATLQMHITDPEAADNSANHIYSVVLSVLQSDEGKPSVIIGTERDATEEISKQRNAAELMRRYKAVFNTAMVDMVFCNSEGYVVNMNERAQLNFNITLEEALRTRRNIRDFFTDGEILTYRYATHALTPDGKPLPEGTSPDKNCRFYEMQLVPVFDKEQKPLGVYATSRDVSEVALTYGQAHAALKDVRKALDELGEYVNNINYVLQVGGMRIVTYSPDTHVLTIFHRMHEAQYVLTQQRCLSLTDESSLPSVMRLIRAMDRRTTASLYAEVKTTLRVNGSQRVCLQVQLFPMADEQGHVTAYEGMCRDVTEMKHTELMLKHETEKAQEIEQLKIKFLHNMCYAIRTPLDTVVESAEIFEREHDLADEPGVIETIKTQTAFLLHLVNDILFLSRLNAHMVEFKASECDFVNTIEIICHNAWNEGRREDVEYVVDHTYEQLVVIIDATNLGRIIDQVVSNAVAHTKKGRVRVRYEYMGGRLVVGIDDTGDGIPKDVLEHVFDQFNAPTGKANSTSLGLPICKELVTQMGGNIDITTEEGKGTTVWISIPCAAKSVVRI